MQEKLELAKVLLINAGAVVISIDNYNKILTAISVTVALIYTIWKWTVDINKKKENKKSN